VAGLSPPGGPGSDRVGESDGSEGDRGQIILVTAFALAVAFVALSVVINGAIFTQNLATRGDTAGGGDALQQRQQAEQMAGDLVGHVNANYSGSADNDTRTSEFRGALGDLSNASSFQQSISGRAVDYIYVGANNGTRITNASGAFESDSGSEDWVVAESVNGTRQFDMEVDASLLNTTVGDAFTVSITNGSASWKMAVYNSSSNVEIETTDGNGNTATCSADSSAAINVTAGLLDGQPCAALEVGENVTGNYDIIYNNSDQVGGSYSLVVNATGGDIGDVTSQEVVLYSATVEYTYRTANLVYETDIRVAPGEPDD
jgi:hypothetical protein